MSSDHLARIADRARTIADLAKRLADQRAALRKDLTAADRTGSYGREELVAAARGGLSRALVLEHLGDISGTVRRALKAAGLTADVSILADGTVTVSGVELEAPRAYNYSTGDDGYDDEPDENDHGYRTAQQADRLNLLNGINAFLSALHRAGLDVEADGPLPEALRTVHGTITVSRRS